MARAPFKPMQSGTVPSALPEQRPALARTQTFLRGVQTHQDSFKSFSQPPGMALSTMRELSVEAQEWGLRVSDPVSKFLDKFGEGMSEERRGACTKIADILEDECGRVTIGAFADLYLHDVQRMVQQGGGGKMWALNFEHFLGAQFKRISRCGVPDSARLVESSGSGSSRSSTQARFPKEKLGQYLKRTGQLQSCVIPMHILEGAVQETPPGTPLVKNDKGRVCREVCLWLIKEYKFVGGCKILFGHLEKQLHRVFPRYWGKRWSRSLELINQNVRRPNAEVRRCSRVVCVSSLLANVRCGLRSMSTRTSR